MDFSKTLIFRLVFMVYGGFKMVYTKTCGSTTLVFGKKHEKPFQKPIWLLENLEFLKIEHFKKFNFLKF